MVNDKFDVKQIYPSKSTATTPKSWFIENGFQNNDRVRLNEGVSGNETDGFKLDDNSKVRFTVCADDKDTDIGCTNDFTKSTSRGYVYKTNDWMGEANSGVEMTGFYKTTFAGPKDNPIIMKGPTGEHHSNTDCCSGSAHMIHIGGEDEDINNQIAMRFSKEMFHVNYHTRSDYQTIPGETWSILDNKWYGVKYIIYKKTINNIKSVVLEVWLNANADKQTWKKVFTTTDSGGWGSGGDQCNGKKDDPLAFGNSRMMWRWDHRDGSDTRFKWLSIRQIDPNADFGPIDPNNPPTSQPTTSTIRATLKLQRNINSTTGIGCGVSGNQVFYEVSGTANAIERFLVNATDQGYRTRIGQRANPAGGSTLKNGAIKEAMWEIREIGSAPGNISCKIWNNAGAVVYTSPTTVTASSLPSTFDGILTSFDFSTNTYNMANGDRVGLQYTSSSDENNCVAVRCRDPGDGSSATYCVAYNESTGVWSDFETRDCICQMSK